MSLEFHPEFSADVRSFREQYREISPRLALRFESEVDATLKRIAASPSSAGHFLNTGSAVVRDVRRANLRSFPCFILYGCHSGRVLVASLIASRSDPLLWLRRLG
jgi:hypothetical protein